MTTHIALLRAVNVGGTGKLPMAELRALCKAAGFDSVRTYIASGNVVLDSAMAAAEVKHTLETALLQHCGKPVGVVVRDHAEMLAVLAANPFADAAPNRVIVVFLDDAPPADALHTLRHQHGEQLALGAREIYVHYGDGIADSKLVIPAAKIGTGRNLNTVATLAAMSAA